MSKRLLQIETRLKAIAAENEATLASLDNPELTGDARKAVRETIKGFNAEYAELNEELGEIENGMKMVTVKAVQDNTNGGSSVPVEENAIVSVGRKSLGEIFVESEGYKKYKSAPSDENRPALRGENVAGIKSFATKATITSSSVGLESVTRRDGFIDAAPFQDLVIADLFTQGETSTAAITFTREIMPVNAAEMIGEGQKKPEMILSFEQVTVVRGKIAVLVKINDEVLKDQKRLRTKIDQRIEGGVKATESKELLTGTGTANKILGVLNTPGLGQYDYDAVRPLVDHMKLAKTQMETVSLSKGTAIVLNPTNWDEIQLSKDANGQYLYGGPGYAPYGNGLYQVVGKIWGMVVVTTAWMPEGEFLLGDFKGAGTVHFADGAEVVIEATNSNNNDFEYNRHTIRGEEYVTLELDRPYFLVHGTPAA